MLARILALFLIMPAVELALLMYVSTIIGFWETVAIIVVTGLVGGLLAKQQGLYAWNRLNQKLAQGGLPGNELVDGVIILIAGALLITPGVITDVVGFAGLIPPSRVLIRKIVLKRLQKKAETGHMSVFMGGGFPPPHGDFDEQWQHYEQDETGDAGDSEADSYTDTAWGGRSRRVPDHGDESGKSGSGSGPGDSI